MAQPGISLIICTHNGRARLGPVLQALQVQAGLDALPSEFILVDNNSTDGTADFVREHWTSSSIELRIVDEKRPGVDHAREAGYRAARYEFICWVDDDNVLPPDYLSRALKILQHHPLAAALGGNGRAIGPDGPISRPDWIPKGWVSHGCGPQGKIGTGDVSPCDSIYTAGAVMRHSALDELYNTNYHRIIFSHHDTIVTCGEDLELCLALRFLGWQIIQSPTLIFDHILSPSRFQWDYCVRLFQTYGQGSAAHTLYSVFLGHRLLSQIKRTWPGLILIVYYNRWKAFRCGLRSHRENDPATIECATIAARTQELNRLFANGRLKQYFLQVRDFHRRSAPRRNQREAQSQT